MMPRPLVTAIVSTYNAERLIAACLEDLEAQTIADRLEIVVIDSGSAQDERGVVERYRRRYGNIVYRRTERETLYAAWNRGIRMARGKYVTNANTDDAHRADALELLSAALEAHPEADLAYGDYEWTSVPNDTFADPHGYRVARHPPYHPAQAMFFCVTGCHPMWRRSLFGRLGWFDPTFTAPGDFEFFMRFAAAGMRAVHVPEVLSLFHQNRTGLTYTQGTREIRRLYPKYRKRIPIHRLYRVDPRKPADVALAWVAQGNLAMSCALPYGDVAVADGPYASDCYRRALAADPACVPALRGLIVCCIRYGITAPLPRLLARLPAPEREDIRTDLRAGRLRLVGVDVPPAVEPLEFPPRRVAHEVPPASIELSGTPATIRSLARRIAGGTSARPRSERVALLASEIRRLAARRRRMRGRRDRGLRRVHASLTAAIERGRRTRDSLRLLSRSRGAARESLIPRVAPRTRRASAPDGSVVSDAAGERVHYLNRTAALVLELCTGKSSWREIVDLVGAAYDLPARPAREVGRVLTALIDGGVLELGRPRSRAAVRSRRRDRA
jgi:glycosyltransferase involved in cell wall biosynthesis